MIRSGLELIIPCSALGLGLHAISSPALAVGTWSDPGTSQFMGSADAAFAHRDPPQCLPAPLVVCPPPPPPPMPVIGFLPGFAGQSFGRIADAQCPFSALGCSFRGHGYARTAVNGVGTAAAVIGFKADALTSNLCECLFNAPGEFVDASASLNATVSLRIETIPPNQSVTVYFAWWSVVNCFFDPEAIDEDPASVDNITLTIAVNNNPATNLIPANSANFVNQKAFVFLPANPANSTGSFTAMDGDVVTITVTADSDAMIQPPPNCPPGMPNCPGQPDQSNAQFHGQVFLSIDSPLPPFQNPMTPGGSSAEFSLDIGSDTELSDHMPDGNELFDPGDMYPWFGPPLPVGGADGVRDDALIFQTDYWPAAPDTVPPSTGAAVCSAPFPPSVPPQMLYERFDLDGSDALEVQLRFLIPPNQPLSSPLTLADLGGATGCLYREPYLLISFDDDWTAHYSWSVCPIPSQTSSEFGYTFGSNAENDEVLLLDTTPIWPPPVGGAPLVSVGAMGGIASEETIHINLFPSVDPNVSQDFDDDVDALDVNLTGPQCGTWYISADHEATGLHPAVPGLPLDPGDIYEVLALGGVTKVIDHAIHLGLPDGTDINGFEFIILRWCDPGNPASCADRLALLFTVDQDDFMTPQDESGGLNPNMIYVSFMADENGDGIAERYEYLSAPLLENIDAIAASPVPFVPATFIPAPANDLCPTAIPVLPGTITFDTSGATTDGPPDLCGNFTGVQNQDADIWYSFIAPCTGFSTITLQPNYDALFAVYWGGCPQAGFVEIGCGSAPAGVVISFDFHMLLGHEYIIRLGGSGGATGTGMLDITTTCTCPADFMSGPIYGIGDGVVDVNELLKVINLWGQAPPLGPADFCPPGGDGFINVCELLGVINAWGPCP